MLGRLVRIGVAGIVLLLLSFLLVGAVERTPIGFFASVQADEVERKCIGADVVILVDQSGSMGGSEKHPVANDGQQLRFKGLPPIIEYLACHRRTCQDEYRGLYHRVAVVYFGSWAETILEPTKIDPADDTQWEPLRQKIFAKLAPEAFPRHLADTDFRWAFDEARKLFNRMPSEGEQRLKVILLLTDGEPYVERTVDDKKEVIPVDEYMSKMLLPQIRRQFPSPPYQLFVIGVNDHTEEYWSEVRDYWEEVATPVGKIQGARLVTSNDIMASFLTDILVELLGGGEEVTDTLKVKPYTKELILYVHKPKPEARVQVKRRDTKSLGKEITVKGENEPIEIITIKLPEPGWIDVIRPMAVTVQARVFAQSIGVETQCALSDFVPASIPVGFSCTIWGDGERLPPYEDPNYRLTIEATLGNKGAYRLPLDLQADGSYATYFIPSETGMYSVTLTGRTKDPAGIEFELFRKPPLGVTPMKVVSTSPALTVREGAVAFVPFPLVVDLRDEFGSQVPVPAGAERYVRMEAVLSGEREFVVPLTVVAGQFTGTVTVYQPGSYRVRFGGEVEDPKTQEKSRPFDAEIGSIEVLPQQVVWEGFSGQWAQYQRNDIAFSLSEKGRLDPTISFTATAWAEAKGKKWDIPLSSPAKGAWKGQFMPQEDGEHVLRVSIWADVPGAGRVPVVEDSRLVSLPVKPMTLVRYQVLTPAEQSRCPWRDIFWRIQPLRITLQLQDRDGKPMAVSDALTDPSKGSFVAEVTPPGGKAPVSIPMATGGITSSLVAAFDQYGSYRWYQYPDLGMYEIRIRPTGALKPDHLWEKPEGLTFTVYITRHPLWWVAPLVVGVALAGVLALTAYEIYLRLWTAEGMLTLEKEGRVLWSCRLNDCGKHTVTFTSRGGLPFPVRKIRVHQARKSPTIYVSVKLPTAEIKRDLSSGQRIPLGGGLFLTYSRLGQRGSSARREWEW